jgi:hypothetical protein
VTIPEKVKVSVSGNTVSADGPKGKLSLTLPPLTAAKCEGNFISVSRATETAEARSMHGLARALINNMVTGVSVGFQKKLEIQPVGFKAAVSGNNVNLSDRREKTNFAPAGEYLSKICAIPVQTFNYIDQSEDDSGLTLGVVAQDVQEVAPELVTESNWGTEEEPKMRLSIYQTDLQYALMKCIQEQQQMIETLQAEVALLKGAA